MFPICYQGESTYQTIMMKNNSSLPAIFKIQINPLSQAHTGAESGMHVCMYVNVRMNGNFGCVCV